MLQSAPQFPSPPQPTEIPGSQRESTVEKVTIQEASHRLNLSQAEIRRYIREGRLQAHRAGGDQGRAWLVELPEPGWQDDAKSRYQEMSRQMPVWWWPTAAKSGQLHYVADLGIEETVPVFLCGLVSENIWTAETWTIADCCPQCLQIARERGLPDAGL